MKVTLTLCKQIFISHGSILETKILQWHITETEVWIYLCCWFMCISPGIDQDLIAGSTGVLRYTYILEKTVAKL